MLLLKKWQYELPFNLSHSVESAIH